MNQRAYLGGRPTLLDVAKGAVESFVKVRQKSPESRGDRYMLITFEEPSSNIKAGWKENLATFMNELKNLQCTGMTTMGAALKNAFDVLNINRMQTGIDTYGQGRRPFFLEPSVIVVITDGGKLSNSSAVQEELNLPMHSPIPGSELTREPFRWDQRLFSLVLRLAGTPVVDRDIGLVPCDTSPIDAMCDVTGGRSYCITSHRMLMQCIDSLVQKVQSGVVINFEKIGPDPTPVISDGLKNECDLKDEESCLKVGNLDWTKDVIIEDEETKSLVKNSLNELPVTSCAPSSTAWQTCRRLIYVQRSAQKGFAVGFWPIPESFWPDQSLSSLPPRSSHPNVKFTCTSQEPMVIENLPFDKYELEPSPLTQYILARKQPTVCWQVFVANSYKSSEVGHPFGYLKASTNLTCVNLFVMPYNYPVLLPLLEELFKVHRQKPTNEWRTQFQNYLRTMPAYYASPLRNALTRMGAPSNLAQALVPDTLDNFLSYSILNYLKRLKNQAKVEFDRLCSEVGSKTNSSAKCPPEGIRVIPKSPLKKELVSHPLLQDKFSLLREQLTEFGGFVVGLPRGNAQPGRQCYRNPFDVPRRNLLDQVVRMRANFLQPSMIQTKLLSDDFAHCMPVSQMGNYQEYVKRLPSPLREIESAPVRQHMFGNPFKIERRMMVDEADIDLVGSSSSGPGSSHRGSGKRLSQQGSDSSLRLPNKRKPGPIPKDFVVRRPSSPAFSEEPPVLVPELPPPVLEPICPDDEHEMLDNGPSEPPKLTMVNGILDSEDDEDDVDGRRFSPSVGGSVNLHYSAEPNIVSSSPPLVPRLANHIEETDKAVLNEIVTNHLNHKVEFSKRELAKIKRHNLDIRARLYREVRKPGKDYVQLFKLLRTLKGPVELQVVLVQQVIEESLRFKRRILADSLIKFIETLNVR
ncbi:hypothetical protein PR048_033166 [Dryococelus australis]|uniref:Integrator complex subunit 6 n=1 Tax=Dryococelus australis TaxID=614101 RepID=A0ABQ9G2B5_9NEOP|nr:hypothetical protein PR048_033166 [Dryococelus australis]